MNEAKYTIIKRYKIFVGDSATGEPMEEQTQEQLHAWLRSRGYSEQDALIAIAAVDAAGSGVLSVSDAI